MRLFILIPTFRETAHLMALVSDLERQTYKDFQILVANSNPDDDTSRFIAAYSGPVHIDEVRARPDLFWTGALALALDKALAQASDADFCMFLNCDVRLSPDFLTTYLEAASRYPQGLFCPATITGQRYFTSGVIMRSWLLSLTDHKLVGPVTPQQASPAAIPVDMLAGRALLFSTKMAREIGGLRPDRLPHYGGDYEFSARAKRHGYQPYVLRVPALVLDARNSGKKASTKGNTLGQRFGYLWDKRSPLELKMRARLVISTYPAYAVPTGVLTVVLKAFVEVLFGRTAHRMLGEKHLVDGTAES